MNRNWIAGLALAALLMGASGAWAGADGKALFDKKCAMCHAAGKKAPLAGIGKKGYSDAKLTELSFTKPPKGMPKVSASADEQKAVIEYLKKL